MKKRIVTISSPLGEPVSLYKNYWEGARLSATLSIVAGLHGGSLNGIYIASRLSHFLQRVAEGREKGYSLAGTVQIFPLVNYPAVESGNTAWPFDHLNLDLAFPGSDSGEVTEKLCNSILQQTSESTYGIILQTGEQHYEDLPHVQILRPNRDLRELSRCLGLATVREIQDKPPRHLQLIGQWRDLHIQGVVISLGQPHSLDTRACDAVVEGIVNFMLAYGLLTHAEEKGETLDRVFYKSGQERLVTSDHAGLFVADVTVGTVLQKGQKLGEIQEVYNGETLGEVFSPDDGVLLTLRNHPLVFEREPLALLLKEKRRRYWPFS